MISNYMQLLIALHIVLGRGPNVDQEDQFPFLTSEKRAIRQTIELNMPYLGFCLGHQLLADALGVRIGPNFHHSIGFIEGRLRKNGLDHPLFYSIPASFPSLSGTPKPSRNFCQKR
jgi:GMP synthase-like glutamine amidotransferase